MRHASYNFHAFLQANHLQLDFSSVIAFMIPPSQPLVQSIEIFANMFFFASLSWAWVGDPGAWRVELTAMISGCSRCLHRLAGPYAGQ